MLFCTSATFPHVLCACTYLGTCVLPTAAIVRYAPTRCSVLGGDRECLSLTWRAYLRRRPSGFGACRAPSDACVCACASSGVQRLCNAAVHVHSTAAVWRTMAARCTAAGGAVWPPAPYSSGQSDPASLGTCEKKFRAKRVVVTLYLFFRGCKGEV